MQSGGQNYEVKVSIIVAVTLIVTALVDFRISAALATAYLIGYGVYRMRKTRRQAGS
jgi:hypothetical protein